MRSPFSYLTSWFVTLSVRFNVYLGATKGLFDASVVLLLVTACTSSAIAMILRYLTVKAALARLARGKTTVTTIADTDWIVVLDNGVVHEQGTQAELLVRPSGLFHQLYKLQTAGRTHP